MNRVLLPDFSVNLNSNNTKIGEIDLQIDPLFGIGNLRKRTFVVLFYPRENVICLHYKKDLFNYYMFWNRTGRLFFINALRLYNDDYDARNLDRNSRHARNKYGTIRGYLIWQQLSFMTQARGNMDVDLGYSFKDRSPYFTVIQRSAKYIDEFTNDENRNSDVVFMYFTRAQAAKLAELFEEYTVVESSLEEEISIFQEEISPPEPPSRSDIPRDDY
ncbi:MAG: hypothetical protein FWB73_05720 [Treponema sp.]|nr:hypothetical protein [Treponema sp.]